MKLNQTEKEAVTLQVQEYLHRGDNNLKTLERISGVGHATLSLLSRGIHVNGKSPIGDVHYRKLINCLQMPISGGQKRHYNIPATDLMYRVCKKSQGTTDRMLLDGPTGASKTYTLESYFAQNEKVVYIKCTSSMSKKDMLLEILKVLGVRFEGKGEKAMMDSIRDRVTSQPGWLIIIDEAEDVKSALYKAIKEIDDFTLGRCGLVVAGADLAHKINGLAERNKVGFPQLRSRLFPNLVKVPAITRHDVKECAKSIGIADKAALDWLGNKITDMRMLSQYLKTIEEVMHQTGEPCTMTMLEDLFINY